MADTGVGPPHGVRQPDVQRELRRLADRTPEGEEARDRHPRGVVTAVGLHDGPGHLPQLAEPEAREDRVPLDQALADELVVLPRQQEIEHRHAEEEAGVPHARGEEGLLAGGGRELDPGARRVVREVADEQVAHQAHQLPEDEQEEDVVAEDEAQHREREQRDVREEDVVAPVTVHVAGGEEVHQERHHADDHQHRRAQAVVEDPRHQVPVARDGGRVVEPAEDGAALGGRRLVPEGQVPRVAQGLGEEHVDRDAHHDEHAAREEPVALPGQVAPEEDLDDVPAERDEGDRKQELVVERGQGVHGCASGGKGRR